MAYTADQIAEAIRVSKEQGFNEADILKGLASYGVTAQQAAAALAPPVSYTPAQVTQAIASSRAAGFSDADIATGLERYRVPVAQTAGAFTPAATTYTPAQVTQAIETSRAQGFSDADIGTGLQRYLPTPAAVTTALTANPRPATTQTPFAPIVRPTAPRPPTYTQATPASFTQTAIANTPYQTVYTPSTMQQATDAQIQAAMQTSNPYQSLMSLTPQRTMPMSYAGPAGVTPANTNLGGFDASIYNPAAATGLLTTPSAGVGGAGGVPGGAERGAGNTADGTGQTAYGMLGNLAGEANRRGFTGLGGFLASGIPVGAEYNRRNLDTGLMEKGTVTLADLAALSSYGGQPEGFTGADTLGGFGPATSGGMAKGGMVNMKPQMHNPPGPDDGYAALDNGEYVIRKSAVKKYGANIFEQINAGRIPAQRLKSLLE
jgi:hypothetical protein